jgi:hypothetical protein
MSRTRGFCGLTFTAILLVSLSAAVCGNVAAQDSSSSSSRPSISRKSTVPDAVSLSPGSITNGIYHNSFFGFRCKIPAGWVLRTDEMNAEDQGGSEETGKSEKKSANSGRVLLAAFSRPPMAEGADVNSSILIAAENAAAYPGLKDAAQYFGPVTEVAKAQGFDVDEEPYEFTVGTKMLVRGDFEKNVGSRVMHQSTLVMLARGYAVSFTFIGGTEDEVDELVQGLSLGAGTKVGR